MASTCLPWIAASWSPGCTLMSVTCFRSTPALVSRRLRYSSPVPPVASPTFLPTKLAQSPALIPLSTHAATSARPKRPIAALAVLNVSLLTGRGRSPLRLVQRAPLKHLHQPHPRAPDVPGGIGAGGVGVPPAERGDDAVVLSHDL